MEIIKYGPKYIDKEYLEMDFETTCPHCQSIFQFNINEMGSKKFNSIIEKYVQCPICSQLLYQNTLNVKFRKL